MQAKWRAFKLIVAWERMTPEHQQKWLNYRAEDAADGKRSGREAMIDLLTAYAYSEFEVMTAEALVERVRGYITEVQS